MKVRLGILLTGLLALTGAGCKRTIAPTTQAATAPAVNPHLIRVALSSTGNEGESRILVNEKEVALADLPHVLRELRRDDEIARKTGDATPLVCEIQAPGELPYDRVAATLVAMAQADIQHSRLMEDGHAGIDYQMPAIDSATHLPNVRLNTRITRKDGATWVSAFDRPARQMSATGAADQQADADLRQLFADKRGDLSPDVQIILQPDAAVPWHDVLTVYDDCVHAQFHAVAFSPPVTQGATPESATSPTSENNSPPVRPARIMKVVYIIDCSASVKDSLEQIKSELLRSTAQLLPVQQFDVVMLSENPQLIFPALQPATPRNRRDFVAKLDDIHAGGPIDGKLQPFRDAFEKAFALKPELIYFVSASTFDPLLLDAVDGFNKDRKIHVNAIDFERRDKPFEEQLKELAKRSDGFYKFVSPKDIQETPPANPAK